MGTNENEPKSPQNGRDIALSLMRNEDALRQEQLKQELIEAKLRLEIEEVRLQTSQLMQQRYLTDYVSKQILDTYSESPIYTNLEAEIRLNMMKTLNDYTINSIHPKNLTIPETTGNKPKVDAETTAEEVPPAPAKQEEPKEQNTTEAKADIAPPTANSESMDAPKETPQTPPANNGSTGNQA